MFINTIPANSIPRTPGTIVTVKQITYTLQGTQGTQGTTGSQGSIGNTGSQGIIGSVGSQGIQGTIGNTGNQGTQGTIGSQGISGNNGSNGSQGIQGIAGNNGSQGTAGSNGSQGTSGSNGSQGTTGSQGIQGITGPVAGSANQIVYKDGSNVATGSSSLTFDGTNLTAPYLVASYSSGDEGGEIQLGKPPNGTLAGGITIDAFQNKLRFFEQGGSARGFYLDISSGGAGVSTAIGSGSGAQGTTGSQGIQGISGSNGSQGTSGSNGSQGTTGTGSQGTQGTKGIASTYSTTIGDGTNTTYTVTHSLGVTSDSFVIVRDTTTNYYVYPDIVYVNTNSIQVIFASAPTTNQYRVTVIGV